ncbi:NUDIX domain-containing protein [Jeotgalibacillus sp. S-D1]|uniref:NUDIX hydrolase n=1 Tax=Jeotgalibacillus sp. S-D1 TaxID=2552189 RepID=UPI00105A1F1B|nr:NUDIX hydrolase [Jeotgalibacillus sp. S-D1]TDL30887.1 NUDIX domain-containing protein [Jeotgalibacillus sp. S-D1]
MDAVFQVPDAVFNYRVAGVWIEKNHVLLHRQANDAYWALPGGRVKVMEDSKTSLVREMQEELGCDVKITKLLWVAENFFKYAQNNFHEIGFYYSISSSSEDFPFQKGEFFGAEGERLVYKWVAINELENLVIYPEFLKTSLTKLPLTPEHVVVNDLSC